VAYCLFVSTFLANNRFNLSLNVLYNHVEIKYLGYPVLGYPVLGYPVLGYPVLGYPVLGYPVGLHKFFYLNTHSILGDDVNIKYV
jgi:hypothetical protein